MPSPTRTDIKSPFHSAFVSHDGNSRFSPLHSTPPILAQASGNTERPPVGMTEVQWLRSERVRQQAAEREYKRVIAHLRRENAQLKRAVKPSSSPESPSPKRRKFDTPQSAKADANAAPSLMAAAGAPDGDDDDDDHSDSSSFRGFSSSSPRSPVGHVPGSSPPETPGQFDDEEPSYQG